MVRFTISQQVAIQLVFLYFTGQSHASSLRLGDLELAKTNQQHVARETTPVARMDTPLETPRSSGQNRMVHYNFNAYFCLP